MFDIDDIVSRKLSSSDNIITTLFNESSRWLFRVYKNRGLGELINNISYLGEDTYCYKTNYNDSPRLILIIQILEGNVKIINIATY